VVRMNVFSELSKRDKKRLKRIAPLNVIVVKINPLGEVGKNEVSTT